MPTRRELEALQDHAEGFEEISRELEGRTLEDEILEAEIAAAQQELDDHQYQEPLEPYP